LRRKRKGIAPKVWLWSSSPIKEGGKTIEDLRGKRSLILHNRKRLGKKKAKGKKKPFFLDE